MKTGKIISIFIILFNAAVFNAQGRVAQPDNEARSPPFSTELIHREIKTSEFPGTEKLIGLLGIRHGMIILDIGAGSGQYSYKFAERLKGTGMVFATDIDADMIRCISQQAKARNIANLFPVLVKREGLDEFYAKNKFDLIFVSNAYHYIRDPVSYFQRLKGSLSKNGRLIIVNYKDSGKFSLGDISDFDGLVKQLSSEKADSPFYSYLRESTRRLLHRSLKDRGKKILEEYITADFNNMVNDLYFLSNFVKNGEILKEGLYLTAEEENYINLAWRFLKVEARVIDDEGVLDVDNPNLDIKHNKGMVDINTILIVQKFRRYLYNGKPAPYLPDGCGVWQNNSKIQKEMLSAGYILEGQYDFIPFEIILVFRAK